MRLSTDFWVSAYLRQSEIAGDFSALVRRGAGQGGSVYIVINRLDGTSDLYAPAPQIYFENKGDERLFYCALEKTGTEEVNERIEKEVRFDRDLWVVERENRTGQHDLSVIDLSD